MYTSRIYGRGQTTLPREVREILRIEPKDSIVYDVGPAGVTIRKQLGGGADAALAADWMSREDREDFHGL